MSKPLLSVIIASYNHESYIAQTLESLEKQTFQDFEIIMIDDGSSDDTAATARLCNSRAQIIEQNNRGVIATRNRGIEMARGKYICFIDSDDIVLPHRFEKQVAVLESNRKIGLVYADALIIDSEGKEIGKFSDVYPVVPGDTAEMLTLHYCFAPMITVMVRVDVLKKTGPFEGYGPLSDYMKWIEVSHISETHYDPEPLGCWRRHPESASKSIDPVVKYAKIRIYLRRVFIKYPSLRARVGYKAKKKFARTYFLTGFFLAAQGQTKLARKYYYKAIKTFPTALENWGGFILTLVATRRIATYLHGRVKLKKLPW